MQQEGVAEPQNNPTVPQIKEEVDVKEGKDIVDYKPNVDYQRDQTLRMSQMLKKTKKKRFLRSRVCKNGASFPSDSQAVSDAQSNERLDLVYTCSTMT